MKNNPLFLLFLIIVAMILSCKYINSIQNNSEFLQTQNIMPDSNFQLSLKLLHRETSQDCNSTTKTITINNDLISVLIENGGFRANEDTSYEKKLTSEMLTKLCQVIEEQKLNVNLTEHNETKGLGIEGHLSLKLTGMYNSEINISGKTNIWGSDQYVKQNWGRQYVESKTNIQNIEYFSKANTLVFLIEKI